MEWGRSEEKGRKIRVWQERPKGISHDCNRWLSSQATWLPDGVFIFYFYFFTPPFFLFRFYTFKKSRLRFSQRGPSHPHHNIWIRLGVTKREKWVKRTNGSPLFPVFFFFFFCWKEAQESRHIRILCNLSGAIHF
jgi:hypothetical protein